MSGRGTRRQILWHNFGTLAATNRHKLPRRRTRKPLSNPDSFGAEWGRRSALNLLVVGSIPTRPTIKSTTYECLFRDGNLRFSGPAVDVTFGL